MPGGDSSRMRRQQEEETGTGGDRNRRRLQQEEETGAAGVGPQSHQPQRFAGRDLDGEEDLVVGHIQDDLALRNQDVPAAVGVGAEGGVGLT